MDKILIIDDDKMSRRMIHRFLEARGFCCIESGNGKHGWETLCENDDILLVITDMQMPDLDGAELVALMRSTSEFFDMPVIIISGALSEESVAPSRDFNPDCTFFIPKPLKMKEIEKLVRTLMTFDHIHLSLER